MLQEFTSSCFTGVAIGHELNKVGVSGMREIHCLSSEWTEAGGVRGSPGIRGSYKQPGRSVGAIRKTSRGIFRE